MKDILTCVPDSCCIRKNNFCSVMINFLNLKVLRKCYLILHNLHKIPKYDVIVGVHPRNFK